ncbi:MAG: SSI family serine proteinase inhibitor [Actinomycetes bacterium]
MGAAGTDLTIVVDDGRGNSTTWHLNCDPAGGDHPNPAVACAVLREGGPRWLPAVPANMACTEIYGGPQTARITGTWAGKAVDARLSRTDGCQIARWNGLSGLLPASTS